MRLSSRSYFGRLLTILPLIVSSLSWAQDDCAPVRLDENGGTFTQIPVHDQKYGTCSIETATQFMEALARQQGYDSKTQFSTLELLVRMSEKYGDFLSAFFMGYNIGNAINTAVTSGVCNSAVVASELRLTNLNEAALIRYLEPYLKRMSEIQATHSQILTAINLRYQERQRLTPVDNVDMGMIRKNYRAESEGIQFGLDSQKRAVRDSLRNVAGMDISQFQDRFDSKSLRSGYEALTQLFPLACSTTLRTYLKKPTLKSFTQFDFARGGFTTTATIPSPVDVQISQALHTPKALPIPIGYCAASLRDGLGASRADLRNLNDSSKCGNHASLIIGQRRNPKTKKCEYLIRNSWGTNYSDLRDSEGIDWEGESYTFQAPWFGFGGRGSGGMATYTSKRNLTGNYWVDRNGFIQNMLLEFSIYSD